MIKGSLIKGQISEQYKNKTLVICKLFRWNKKNWEKILKK